MGSGQDASGGQITVQFHGFATPPGVVGGVRAGAEGCRGALTGRRTLSGIVGGVRDCAAVPALRGAGAARRRRMLSGIGGGVRDSAATPRGDGVVSRRWMLSGMVASGRTRGGVCIFSAAARSAVLRWIESGIGGARNGDGARFGSMESRRARRVGFARPQRSSHERDSPAAASRDRPARRAVAVRRFRESRTIGFAHSPSPCSRRASSVVFGVCGASAARAGASVLRHAALKARVERNNIAKAFIVWLRCREAPGYGRGNAGVFSGVPPVCSGVSRSWTC